MPSEFNSHPAPQNQMATSSIKMWAPTVEEMAREGRRDIDARRKKQEEKLIAEEVAKSEKRWFFNKNLSLEQARQRLEKQQAEWTYFTGVPCYWHSESRHRLNKLITAAIQAGDDTMVVSVEDANLLNTFG